MKRLVVAFTTAILATTLHAQEPKNVQLLKGMTPMQLQRTMNMMRASLGVHCDFCHVVTKESGWDWASDDKEEKKIARTMIRITTDLNSDKYFNRAAVTCNTCHRGALHPVALPALPQAQPPFPTPAEENPALPSRDDVVAKYAHALGHIDEQALASVNMKGVRESYRGTAESDVITAPGNRVRVTSKTAEGETVNVLNGATGWTRTPKETSVMSASQVENMMQLADAFRLVLPREIPADAKVTSRDKIGDRQTWVITMPWGAGGRQRLYFDAQSGLLARRVTLMTTQIGNVPQQTDYDDYRDVGGIKLPFVVKFESVDPWIGSTRRYTEIRLNATVDDKVFEQPK